jgi:ABC-type lipoprotein export system ATPase subunit
VAPTWCDLKTWLNGKRRRVRISLTAPTAALGVQETAQVENIFRTLKEQGEPLILISHNMRHGYLLRASLYLSFCQLYPHTD